MKQFWTREKVQEVILPRLEKGEAVIQVASSLGMKRQRVYFLLKRFGFPTPSELRQRAKTCQVSTS